MEVLSHVDTGLTPIPAGPPHHRSRHRSAPPAREQFVIATHSPILLACPDAAIYELDDAGLAPCAYDDLDTVRFTRAFLDAPARFVHAALDDLD